MTQDDYRLNMDMMFAVHDALRRDLVQVARIAKSPDSPVGGLTATPGWQDFRKFLGVHHAAEDEAVWAIVRAHAAGQPEALALADALEEEHSAIDPLLASIDAAAAASDGYQLLGDRVAELVTALTEHLAHEESDGLALIDSLMTPEEWMNFAKVHREAIGDGRVRYLPWLMEEGSERTVEHVNGSFPEQLLSAYRAKWGPDYAATPRWEVPS